MESVDSRANELEMLLNPTVGGFLDLRYMGLSPHETVLAMMRDHTADDMLVSMAADHLGSDALDPSGNPRQEVLATSKELALGRIDAMLALLNGGQVSLESIDENFDVKALCAIRLIEREEGIGGSSKS